MATSKTSRSGEQGAPAKTSGDQPRRNLVSGGSKNPNHDAVIRIGQRMSFGHSAVATLCRHHLKHDLELFKVRDFAPDFAQLLRQRFD